MNTASFSGPGVDAKDKIPLPGDFKKNYGEDSNGIESSTFRRRKGYIEKNLEKVDEEIRRRVYQTNKSKLEKITISEVFSRMAKDSAYILGRILQAGYEGAKDERFSKKRDKLQGEGDIIGKHFPLFIANEGENDGKELPASSSDEYGFSEDIGVDEYELRFVKEFIEAVSQGVAESAAILDVASGSLKELKGRINNLDLGGDNPFKPNYWNIATGVLIRSGFGAYLTRSSDPNFPGDYPDKWIDKDSVEDMVSLADLDSRNITDDHIATMSIYDRKKLKLFCNLWVDTISNDGTEFVLLNGEKFDPSFQKITSDENSAKAGNDSVTRVSSKIYGFPYWTDIVPGTSLDVLSNKQKKFDSTSKIGNKAITIKQVFQDLYLGARISNKGGDDDPILFESALDSEEHKIQDTFEFDRALTKSEFTQRLKKANYGDNNPWYWVDEAAQLAKGIYYNGVFWCLPFN